MTSISNEMPDASKDADEVVTPTPGKEVDPETGDLQDIGIDVDTRDLVESQREAKERCHRRWTIPLGVALTALFIISVLVQFNDDNSVGLWFFFYLLHALLSLSGILRQFWCGDCIPNRPMFVVSLAMGVYSIVLLGIASKAFAEAEKGGPESGGDNNRATDREEKMYEVAGAALGLFSAIHHTFFFGNLCCFQPPGVVGQ